MLLAFASEETLMKEKILKRLQLRSANKGEKNRESCICRKDLGAQRTVIEDRCTRRILVLGLALTWPFRAYALKTH
jgi:hypothetical protein